MRLRYPALLLLLILIQTTIHAQKVQNVRAEKDGDYVKIIYDLEGEDSVDKYDVELYGSHNNFTAPLQMVTGDIGENIAPGQDKLVIWRPREELSTYTGEIVFEVRATVMGAYYKINAPTSASKFKKGKSMTIRWSGGEPSEKLRIELKRYDGRVETIAGTVDNSGSYTWTAPKSIKGGKGYQVQIVNTSDAAKKGTSKTFKVSGGIPVAVLIAAPVVVGGVIAAVLLSGGDDDDDDDDVIIDDDPQLLPDPPGSPDD